jgi:hypothetical protein
MSVLIPVRDHGVAHLAAEWGGTAFNFTTTSDKSERYWFQQYIRSAERFRDLATHAGADVVISNHASFDGSKRKIAALAVRTPRDIHPYVVGTDAVRRYFTVAEECAKAGLLRLSAGVQ